MMTSFGDGISLTPLEYAALIGAVANGGTLYYLQYPKSDQEAQAMVPRVKRRLDIDNLVSEIKPGMMGAVEYGTARRAGFRPELAGLRQNRHLHRPLEPDSSRLVRFLRRHGQRQICRGRPVDRRQAGQRPGSLRRRGQRI